MTVIACDLGGTRAKLALLNNREILAQAEIASESEAGLGRCLTLIVPVIRELLQRARLQAEDCLGVGIAMPGVVDPTTLRVLEVNGKFVDAPEIDIPGWARAEFGLPLALENDARAALIGECEAGAGSGVADAVMMTLGTGIGSAAVIGGKVLRGAYGSAGNMGGHFTVSQSGRRCSCPNIGCAEAEASSVVLAELARAQPSFAASRLARAERIDYRAVFEAAAAGDECAEKLVEHSVVIWASLAVNLIHAFDPSRVILGGGIMKSAQIIVPRVQAYVDRHAWTPQHRVEVVPAKLGNLAALLGCERLLNERL